MTALVCFFANVMQSDATILVRGLRRRDPELLDALIEEYQHRLFRYLVYLSGDRELAAELFQETWIRVMERGHLYDGRREFRAWLYAVARNLTVDHLRKARPLSLDGLLDSEDGPRFEPADRSPSAWQLIAQQEQTELVTRALTSLPAEYREAIVLRFVEELPLQEIATVVAAPLSTVKSRIYRGLNLLLHQLRANAL